jgi:DNA invertase Pin-like site-specific DNA recombinase
MKKICIYARISTKHQDLDHQIASCKKFCDYKGLDVVKIYKDIGSGKDTKRQDYLSMIKEIRSLNYDGVVVFRIDRLGRNLREMVLLIEELTNKGIEIYSVNESIDASTAIGRAMLNLILVFAEFEREQLSEATQQRLKSLKEAGTILGRRKAASDEQIKRIMELYNKLGSINSVSKKTHLSYGTVYNVINKRGIYQP